MSSAGKVNRGEPAEFNRALKKPFLAGCSKMPRCKAPEIMRSEAYFDVRRNDEG